ncbi:MAG: urease accessory protein UreD [Acidimicrobiales bacterium]
MAVHDAAVRHLEVNPPLCARVRHHADIAGPLTEVWLVSSGASLLEGDELTVRVELSGGARVAVRSVSASVVHPCPGGGWAEWTLQAHLADRSQLLWWPEPTVVAAGARYRARSEVDVGPQAALAWADEVVLGRTGEEPHQLSVDIGVRINRDGAAVLRDGLRSAPGWTAAAVTGGARYLGTRCLVGGASPTPPADGQDGQDGWMALAASGCWSRRVLAPDPLVGRCELGAPASAEVVLAP